MNSILDLLLYRHRRFKGETYFKNRFFMMLFISIVFSIFIADSYIEFLIVVGMFLLIDLMLVIAAWFYYRTDL
jgi:hypothetical protein